MNDKPAKINSRSKGKRGELDFCKVLLSHGIEARRGQQYKGGTDSPDVITNLTDVHFEVKFVEAGNPYDWMAQANRDKKPGAMPIVAHRRSQKRWIAVVDMEDLVPLLVLREGFKF